MALGQGRKLPAGGVFVLLALVTFLTSCGNSEKVVRQATIACETSEEIERLYRVSMGMHPGVTVGFLTDTLVDVGICYRIPGGQVVTPQRSEGNAREVAIPGHSENAWILADQIVR